MNIRRQGTLAIAALWLVYAALVGAQSSQGVVNINTATAEQLDLLPRIGPALASRIIDFREANGKFKSTEELILVRGIGESLYGTLEPFVTVEGTTTLKAPVRIERGDSEN